MADPVFRDRDAWATIRGFLYQVQITIQRWLDLKLGEELRLECGEDIDRIGRALNENGTVREHFLLEQVKHREKNLTLRSPEALAALALFQCHRVANPKVRLRFRYVTNASIGSEAMSQMPGGVAGIVAWERLRLEGFGPSEEAGVLAGIRSVLSIAPKPAGVHQGDWQGFHQFIGVADDTQLLSLVRSVEWAACTTSFELIDSEIEQQLVASGRASSPEDSHSLYERLVLFVLKRLSISGPKSLSPEDLNGVISVQGISSHDRQMLQTLLVSAAVSSRDIREIKQVTSDLREMVRGIAAGLGLGDLKAILAQQIPIDVPPSVQRLAKRDANVSKIVQLLETTPYCAVHGDIGSGKTQIAVLLSRQHGGSTIWVRMRQLTTEQASQALDAALASLSKVPPSPKFTAWYSKACRALGSRALIVLDDLPRVFANDQLSARLAILARICEEQGLRIVSTSPYELPIAFREQTGALVVTAKVPPFSDDEIEELFFAHGMPRQFNIRKFIPVLEAVTRRHPMLLAAAARYMESAEWALDWGVLEGFLKGVFADELKPDTQQMLLATVPDPSTRNLLYRLTLADLFFTREQAVVVASVDPPLDMPIERFDGAVGLWIQSEHASMYSLVPLLRNRELDLSANTQRTIHLALAHGIMEKRVLDPLDVLKAFTHFSSAGSHQQAAGLLLMALMDFNDLEEMPNDWGISEVWTQVQLPTKIDLTVRLLLRAQQSVVSLRRGKDTEYLLNDFDKLLSQAGQAQYLATTVGCTLLAVRLRDDQPSRANRYLSRALATGQDLTLPDGTPVMIPREARLEHLVWATASAAKTESDIQSCLSVLEGLSPDQLSRAFESEHAENGCVIFCDGLWLREAAKPPEEQQWVVVIEQLKVIEETARRLGGSILQACAVRAQICVLGECTKDLDQAASLATKSLELLGSSPRARFLVMEVSGRAFVYSERWSDATKWLKEAVDLDEDSFPILRINALIALSEALSHTVDAASAIPPCERAVKIAKLLPGAMEITLAHALGENAIASWYAGDRKSAYSLIEECVNRILKCKEDKTIWKKTFTVTGYVCSYFSVMARYGKLPEGMTEAEPPRRGVFNDIDPSMAELYESDKEWLIAAQLATFAAALGEDQGAATWALRAVEMGRTAAGGEISGMVKRFALTQAILDQRYLDALELAVGAMAALVSSVTRSQVQLPPTLLPPKSLTELSASDLEARSIETVLFMGLVPIAFGLATIWLDDAGSAAEVATSMATRCRELAEDTDSPDRWNQAADVVVRAFNTGASMDELKELGEKFVSISASLQITCYLGAMLRARPEHAIKVQLTIIPLLESRLGNEGAYRRVVVPFLRRFWENKLEQSPFYFQAPQRTLGVVKGTKITPANLAVRQLFEEVSRSLGYTPDADERRWLNNASSVSSAGNN